ncbi:MAG: response regulator [Deltaproteobacteria bacterium]|nr:response regulator [Deltaproteobacteria bacterium]
MMAGYETWLFAHRPDNREHLWFALVSVAAAFYAGVMAVHYNASPESAILLTRLEMIPLVAVVHFAPLAAMDLVQRSMPIPRWAFVGSAILWLFLIPTVVGDEVVMREFYLLDHPFPRRAESVLGGAAMVYALAMALLSVTFLWRNRRGREQEFWYFVTGIALWVATALLDGVLGLVGAPMALSLFEYGFCGFALALGISDLRRYREMLDATQRDFRGLIDRAPEAVGVLIDHRFVYGNAALLRMLRIEGLDQLRGTPIHELVHPEDVAAVRALLDAPDENHVVVTARLVRPRAEPAQLELTALHAVFDGQPAVVLGGHDVSTRNQLTARVMEMDRMITVGTVAAGVGHEINNPLSYVLLNLQEARKLLEKERDIAAALDCIDYAVHGADRINETVRGLAVFSHHGASRQDLSLKKVIESAAAMAANEVAHRAQLVLDLASDLVVHGNETRLGQVIVNLLSNAAHAIDYGSAEDNVVRVQTFVDEDLAVCEVSDTGAGIAEKDLERIFEPFFTTKPAGQGTGLGLWICRATVEEEGGHLLVSSKVGKGSVFRLELPLVHRELPADAPVESSIPPRRRGRLLVVDDEALVLQALSRSLRDLADVVVAASVAEALDHLEEGPTFDLIVSDLMMPNASGMDLYDTLQKRHPTLAASMVFITGGTFTPEARAFQARIDNVVLDKPVRLDALRSYVRQAVDVESGA